MNDELVLTVDGAVERPLRLTLEDLDALPETVRIHDVSRFHPSRRGDGVTLEAILEQARVRPEANYLTLHADRDDFHVSVPLAEVKAQGILVYRVGPELLGPDQGGPVRFLVKDPAACHTGELDECANVKYLRRIELTSRRGRDTRPATEPAHAALHQSQAAAERPGTGPA
jgi:DMSO/TMAO reductase YedYZ molybdopterin-dependent catalytic subunit